uniref:Uncharacterized protein n=1 Tax=Caedibacter taeniospiralis TaxID=28907 RepID=Q6TFH8_CAETA|nr:hypothetical protein [Caedibacter taeniospiralis]AAR87080.1 hypothetical protein [Caedibacter taeniospiralis]
MKNNGSNLRKQYFKDNGQMISNQLNAELNTSLANTQQRTQSFKELSETFSDKGSDKLARTALLGFSTGMNIADNQKRREKLDKFNQVMSYLTEQNQAMDKELQAHQAVEYTKEKMRPYASAFLKNMKYMDNQTLRQQAENMLRMSNQLSGEEVSLLSIDNTNPAIWTMMDKANGETGVVDMGMLYADHDNANDEYALLQTERALHEQVKREMAQQRMDIQAQHNELGWENLKQRYTFHEPEKIFNEHAAKTAAQIQQKEIPTLQAIIEKTALAERKIDDMLSLVDGNEDVFNSQLMSLWMSEEPSALGNALRSLATKLNPEKSTVITKLNKYINELVIDKAALFTRPNMFLERIGSKSVPNWMMTADAFKDMLHDMKNDVQFSKNHAYQKFSTYTQNNPTAHWKTATETVEHPIDSTQSDQVSNVPTVFTVKDPNTGQIMRLNARDAKIAVQRGGVIV